MWKKALLLLGVLILLGALALAYLATAMMKPELLRPEIRREFTIAGLAVGKATRQELIALHGPPEREVAERRTTVYRYPSRGLAFRMENETGQLIWYELRSPDYATGQGITVGASFDQIRAAYGKPTEVTPTPGGARVRYTYGMAYVLEFRLGPDMRVRSVTFFRV